MPLAKDTPKALMAQAPEHTQRDFAQAAALEALLLLVLLQTLKRNGPPGFRPNDTFGLKSLGS